jgi:hypothetical protein
MSKFVEEGVAKVRETFAEVSNAHPADIARAVLEHIDEWAPERRKAPAPPAEPKAEEPK